MRRPRSKLEVSTFPFLAVLLCAMGSLLLLLFIMDRRAKIAAQHRTSEALAEYTSRTQAEEEARKAEWDKAKQLLHQSLVEQQNQLDSESKGFQQHLADAGKKLEVVQAKHIDLKQKIEKEAAKIGVLQLDVASQDASLKETAKKETMSKAELIAAAKELADLERAFVQLRKLRERDKQTYSVVPYRGKRGDLRPPIYVECVREGVIFHPEKKLLQGWDFTDEMIRSEVEQRHGPLAIQKASKEKGKRTEEAKGPYVLFLIRPDGIGSYYKGQSALKGYQLDFGYELVDADWTLDFSGEPHAKNSPSMQRPTTPVETPKSVATPVLPLFPGNGTAKEGPAIGQGTLPAPPIAFQPSLGNPGGNPGSGNPLIVPPPTGFAGGSPVAPPIAFQPSLGNPGSGNPLIVPPPTGFAGGSPVVGNGPAVPSKGPSFVPIAKGPPLISIATSDGSLKPIASSGNSNESGNPSNSPNGTSSQEVNPIKAPIPGNSVSGQRPGGVSGPSGVSGDQEEPQRKGRPPIGVDPGKNSNATPPLSRLLGNKDFVITIECHADYVIVTPGSITFRLAAANQKATDQAIVQTITNLIARRQTSVRPGEPPYRPLIRFHVSAEGLRSYLHVYPLLEHLRMPMTRENIED